MFTYPRDNVKIFASAKCPWAYRKFENKDRKGVINKTIVTFGPVQLDDRWARDHESE